MRLMISSYMDIIMITSCHAGYEVPIWRKWLSG